MPRLSLTGFDANNKAIVRVSDPSNPTDAANKQYVDQTIQAVNDLKDPVRGTTTSNLALTALVNNLVHDGITYVTGDRILLKNQTTGSENGIYVIAASGSGTRATDADQNSEVTKGFATTVLEGNTKGTGTNTANPVTYVLTNQGTITLGTTTLNFSPIGGVAAAAKTAGNGLTETGSTYDVGTGTGIQVGADTVSIDTSIVTRKASFDCAATTNPQTFTHNLNTRDVDVTIREVSGHTLVDADVVATDVNSISVNFGGAPSAGQYRITIMG